MSSSQPYEIGPLLPEATEEQAFPDLKADYKIKLEQLEVEYLARFLAYLMQVVKERQLLLELATAYDLSTRYKMRFLDPKKCTMRFRLSEALAIKRLLWYVHYPDATAGVFLNSLHGKLDQVLPKVY